MGNEKKYIIGNQDIDASFVALETIWRGLRDGRVNEQIDSMGYDSFCEIVAGSTLNFYVETTAVKAFVERCAERVFADDTLLPKLKRGTEVTSKAIRDFSYEVMPTIDELSRDRFPELLRRIDRLQVECVIYGSVVAFADLWGSITNRLVEILSKRRKLIHPLSVYSGVLALPEQESLTARAYADIARSPRDTHELLKEYFWLDQGYIGRGLTKEALEEIKRTYKGTGEKLSRAELFFELNLDITEQRAFTISQDIIYTKALRVDSRQFLNVVLNRIIDRVAAELCVESKMLASLTAEELCDVIAGRPLPENVSQRWAHSVCIPEVEGRYRVLVGADVDTFLQKNLLNKDIKDTKTTSGQTAYGGVVTGVVRLVFGPQHNIKVKDGDILIAPATSPQLLPAMKRAAAFITDVGGITSHAAIVARELKIPCVVGAKIATQIFKDGDVVEVNADKGIVKIIKRA